MSRIPCVLLVLLFLCTAPSRADDDDEPAPEPGRRPPADEVMEDEVDQSEENPRLRIAPSEATGLRYLRAIERGGDRQLREWAESDSIELSLMGYWQLLREKTVRTDTHLLEIRDRAGEQRFLGFLLAKTKLQPPEWWESAFVQPRWKSGELYGAAFQEAQKGPEPLEGKKRPPWYRLRTPPGVVLRQEKSSDLVEAASGDRIAKITPEAFELASKHITFVECFQWDFDKDLTVIVFYSGIGHGALILGIEPDTGKIRWRNSVWAGAVENLHLVGASGSWHQYIELVRKDGQIAVFGEGVNNAWMETFDLNSGKNLYRFSTNLWNVQVPDRRPPLRK
jgi:hypothetical protein